MGQQLPMRVEQQGSGPVQDSVHLVHAAQAIHADVGVLVLEIWVGEGPF